MDEWKPGRVAPPHHQLLAPLPAGLHIDSHQPREHPQVNAAAAIPSQVVEIDLPASQQAALSHLPFEDGRRQATHVLHLEVAAAEEVPDAALKHGPVT